MTSARAYPVDDFTRVPRVAYFSMEIALENDIPTYSGGLGVLAGDLVRSAADLGVPIVAVSLVSRAGYFKQTISDSGEQREEPQWWEPRRFAEPLHALVSVPLQDRDVWVRGWLYTVESPTGRTAPVILLDTDLEQNVSDDRQITHQLYAGGDLCRLKQYAILGIGGVRLLTALGFQIIQYHMNEGHAALLAVELLRRTAHPRHVVGERESPYDVHRVRAMCSFTTHTPVEAAQARFDWNLVRTVLGAGTIDESLFRQLAGDRELNATRLALNTSEYVNGVSERHARLAERMYPGAAMRAIDNGVHVGRWTHRAFAALYEKKLPGWFHEPELLTRADQFSDEEIVGAHAEAKAGLLDLVEERTGMRLAAAAPIVGFARRMTAYKRLDLLFSDLGRLREIARAHPFQIVVAGKAHPADWAGKEMVAGIHRAIGALGADVPCAFIPNYDLRAAAAMTSGSDVWLNTPLPPLEASGTSGMKAALNGVPSLSTVDGWWVEGWIEGVTGWAIGEGQGGDADGQSLYQKLGGVVLPLFYGARDRWAFVMKSAISKNAALFNSHRMLRRYAAELYIG
jgi:starch phosphorylase